MLPRGGMSSMAIDGLGEMYFSKAAAGGGSLATWDPAAKNASITLSNGNLTATAGAGGYLGIRSNTGRTTGKIYWEVTVTTDGNVTQTVLGIGNASASLSNFTGSDANAIGCAGGGNVYKGGSQVSTVAAWVQGDTICIALDLANSRIWWRTNGGNWNNNVTNNPATNVGGVDISSITTPMFAQINTDTSGDVFTANFGATAYAQSVPSGFGNW